MHMVVPSLFLSSWDTVARESIHSHSPHDLGVDFNQIMTSMGQSPTIMAKYLRWTTHRKGEAWVSLRFQMCPSMVGLWLDSASQKWLWQRSVPFIIQPHLLTHFHCLPEVLCAEPGLHHMSPWRAFEIHTATINN